MRELKRNIARHMMEMNGITQINKKRFDKRDANGNLIGRESYFSRNWKKYLDPESDVRKVLHNKLRRAEADYMRRYQKPIRVHTWPLAQ